MHVSMAALVFFKFSEEEAIWLGYFDSRFSNVRTNEDTSAPTSLRWMNAASNTLPMSRASGPETPVGADAKMSRPVPPMTFCEPIVSSHIATKEK